MQFLVTPICKTIESCDTSAPSVSSPPTPQGIESSLFYDASINNLGASSTIIISNGCVNNVSFCLAAQFLFL